MSVNTASLKQKVIDDQAATELMRVWRKRLPTDDGFQFAAAKKSPGPEWSAASPDNIRSIAVRALLGM